MIDKTSAWLNLKDHFKTITHTSLKRRFDNDFDRAKTLSAHGPEIFLDYSKNHIEPETIPLLCKLAETAKLDEKIEAMFTGKKINTTEKRAVLHTALRNRSNSPVLLHGEDVMPEINATLDKMRCFVDDIHSGVRLGFSGKKITDVVNIGIGGSDLGPHMVTKALKPYRNKNIRSHFVSNIDPTDLTEVLELLNPETTLFIISSKTFSTEETLTNANAAKRWLSSASNEPTSIAKHFVAVSANPAKAAAFGIDPDNVFAFWDWVGGRYSLWSAIGLPIALSIGMDGFEDLLEGAHEMDVHFRETEFHKNIPVLLALIGIWYCNFYYKPETHAIIPYAQSLSLLPSYLQQLDMESNGKQITYDGRKIHYKTGPVIWGGAGTNGQHAFHQLLHQGTRLIPIDFIAAKESANPLGDQHIRLFANCLAQAEALMAGREVNDDENYRAMPGSRPSNMILMEKLTPKSLGALIAMYEHKVFTQGVIWNLNSFDQWGVELGKQMAKNLFTDLTTEVHQRHDTSTDQLIGLYKNKMSVASDL